MLVNFPEIRIKQYPEGFVVEKKMRTWYGREYWVHVDASAGLDTVPWHYGTDIDAENGFLLQVKRFIRWDSEIINHSK